MLIRRSDDCAGPPGGTDPLPLRGERRRRLTKGGPSADVWAAGGLVVIGTAVAILVPHQPRGQTRPGVESTQCGLVPCVDVPSAAASVRSGHGPGATRSRPVPSSPPAPNAKPARTPGPVHT